MKFTFNEIQKGLHTEFGEMPNVGIIKSLLDTDKYKFTMMDWVFHNKPNAWVTYSFKCRNSNINLVKYLGRLNKEFDVLCELKFSANDLRVLKKRVPELSDSLLKYLFTFKLDRKQIKAYALNDNEIEIEISGKHLDTILFEIYALSIVNQVYTEYTTNKDIAWKQGAINLQKKLDYLQETNPLHFNFSEFGTRRRYSFEWQDYVISQLVNCKHFNGTSNVYFAEKYDIPCIGTMAHEYLQCHQSYGPNLRDFQKSALHSWIDHFQGKLGIALSDVIGLDAFLRDFDKTLATKYAGTRHDSGDPYEWAMKTIQHYEKLDINPNTKVAVFSDGLTIYSAVDLYFKTDCHEIVNGMITMFGIGTSLTNDMSGEEAEYKPINIVLKVVECDGLPVAKLSDSAGKEMCKDPEFIVLLRKVNHIPIN